MLFVFWKKYRFLFPNTTKFSPMHVLLKKKKKLLLGNGQWTAVLQPDDSRVHLSFEKYHLDP